MAYPAHHLFVVGGVFTGASNNGEIWQIGVRGVFNGGGESNPEALHMQRVEGPLKTWWAAAGNKMRSDASLRYLKLNAIAPDGSYATPNDPHTRQIGATAGGLAPALPNFVNLAWSWRTAAPGRLALNGRVYPPNAFSTSGLSSGSSRVTSTEATDHAQAAETLLGILYNAGNGSQSTTLAPYVVSAKGSLYPITNVRVGDVVDVQRRRKNKLQENYTTVPYIP